MGDAGYSRSQLPRLHAVRVDSADFCQELCKMWAFELSIAPTEVRCEFLKSSFSLLRCFYGPIES
jgi:hypothetical protein